MPKTSLTDAGVRAVKAPARGQVTIWGTSSPVGIRVSQGGANTFMVMLGQGRRYTIGRYGEVTIAEARDAARRLRAERTLGRLLPRSVPLADARREYLAQIKVRPNTRAYYIRTLNRLKATDLSDVTPPDINRIVDGPGASSANQAFASLRTFFQSSNYDACSPAQRPSLTVAAHLFA